MDVAVPHEEATSRLAPGDGPQDRGRGAPERPQSMRLWIGVWPPEDVVEALRRLDRPARAGVRWTTQDQWHVTLRFLGQVAHEDVPALAHALQQVARRHRPVEVELGPRLERLNRHTLVVPVTGLEALAADVVAATAHLGAPPDDRPFHGHLTLARARRRAAVPTDLADRELRGGWRAGAMHLVHSHLEASGSRYVNLGEFRLTA